MKNLLLSILLLSSISIFASNEKTIGLSGTYTIGNSSADYLTFQDAINDLNSSGVSGAVTFNIKSGLYSEQLNLVHVSGSTEINTITFQAETQNALNVELTGVIVLDSANYFRFKHLTFSPTSSTAKIISVNKKTENLKIENNIFNNGASGYGFYRNSDNIVGHHCDSININNNVFNNGLYAIYLKNGDKTYTKYSEILNNEINNSTSGGIVVTHIGREYNDAGSYLNENGKTLISNNKIIGTDISFSGTHYGISTTNIKNSTVNNNLILIEANSGTTLCGILESNCGAGSASNYNKWYNNVVNISSTSASCNLIGLQIVNGDYQEFAHNSFITKSAYTATSIMYVNSGTQNKIYNNDFINLTSGVGSYILKTHTTNPPTTSVALFNYNNYNHLGTYFTNWTSVDYSFEDYKTNTGFDANSTTIASGFAIKNDFTVQLCANLENLGMASDYDVDFNGVSRNVSSPTIGALETFNFEKPIITVDADFTEFCGNILNDKLQITSELNYLYGSYNWIENNSIISNSDMITVDVVSDTTITKTYRVYWSNNTCASDTLNIDITSKKQPEISIIADASDLQMTIADTSGVLTWYFDGSAISNSDTTNFTATESGSYYLEQNIDGCIGVSNTVNVTISGIENEQNSKLKIYPNPISETLYLEGISKGNEVKIYNVLGENIVNFEAQNNIEKINFEQFEKGIYMISIFNENKLISTHKIVK
jgi:hypothetical protein